VPIQFQKFSNPLESSRTFTFLVKEIGGGNLAREANTVYVGRKPLMNYVLAVVTSFNASNANQVVLKARGRAISAAVDIAEISTRSFLKNVTVDRIDIGSEEIPVREENRMKTVSTMEITLARVPKKNEAEDEEEEKPVDEKHPEKLTDIKGIGAKTAEQLESAGINSIRDLANSDLTKLSEGLQISEKRLSSWVDEAQKSIKPQ
jgi:DNA-binding protein